MTHLPTHLALRCLCRGTLLFAGFMLVTSTAEGAPQPLIKYFQPMPIVGRLSTTVWGASTVGARDPANGLEDNGSNGGVGPRQETNFYWDGKIVKGEDGKYHLYASRWAYSNGFGPPVGASGTGWQSSIPIQAVSDNIMGPYVSQGDCYTRNQEGNNKGHNTTALVTPTGAAPYTLSVGEIVAGQMFSASSANGPWTLLGLTKTNNNGHNGCGTLSSNFTFTVGPDNRFWATSRSGCIMDSDQVLGTYKVETDSVLPNLENNGNANAEDEVIWYSGGYYHIVYNYWHVQRAYHIMSKNGTTNWTSTGLAYQGTQTPANASSSWLRYTDGTVNQWHNMERVSVYQESGHVTHFTFAVTDVDKNTSGREHGRQQDPGGPVQRRAVRLRQWRRCVLRRSGRRPRRWRRSGRSRWQRSRWAAAAGAAEPEERRAAGAEAASPEERRDSRAQRAERAAPVDAAASPAPAVR